MERDDIKLSSQKLKNDRKDWETCHTESCASGQESREKMAQQRAECEIKQDNAY